MLQHLGMSIDNLKEFLAHHQSLAPLIIFALSFGESMAFVSFVFPFTAALAGIGLALGPLGLSFWSIWLAASLGAAIGDWVSYLLGATFGWRIGKVWPLTKYPRLLPMGRLMFRRYGWLAVVIGRLSVLLRSAVPLVAGICKMPQWKFQLANFGSALAWTFILLAPGTVIGRWMGWS
jgi:membrane protein DedA with SNARE-associated domain